jgi:hypothetical protein
MLTLQHDAMNVLDQTMPITVIREWEVSIRPCEVDNFARLFDILTDIRISSPEYVYLMRGLTAGSGSLLDLIDMPDDEYKATRAEGTSLVKTPQSSLRWTRRAPVEDAAKKAAMTNAP